MASERQRTTTFFITVETDCAMDLDEIWPDGDAPSFPTSEDVIAAMKQSGSISRVLSEWGLSDFEINVSGDGTSATWHA